MPAVPRGTPHRLLSQSTDGFEKLSAVRAVYALAFRCCSMTDVEGGKRSDGSAALLLQNFSKSVAWCEVARTVPTSAASPARLPPAIKQAVAVSVLLHIRRSRPVIAVKSGFSAAHDLHCDSMSARICDGRSGIRRLTHRSLDQPTRFERPRRAIGTNFYLDYIPSISRACWQLATGLLFSSHRSTIRCTRAAFDGARRSRSRRTLSSRPVRA